MKSAPNSDLLPVQCKMARVALGLGVRDLALSSKVSTDTIVRFEKGEILRDRTVVALREALEKSGAEFIPENGGGAGVRLVKVNARCTQCGYQAEVSGSLTSLQEPFDKCVEGGRPGSCSHLRSAVSAAHQALRSDR